MTATVRRGSRVLDALDPYTLKHALERVNELRELATASADLGFLRRARQATLPLPLIDRPRPVDSDVFPPFKAARLSRCKAAASRPSPAAEAAGASR